MDTQCGDDIMLAFFIIIVLLVMAFILIYKFIHEPDYTYTDEPRFPKIPKKYQKKKRSKNGSDSVI